MVSHGFNPVTYHACGFACTAVLLRGHTSHQHREGVVLVHKRTINTRLNFPDSLVMVLAEL